MLCREYPFTSLASSSLKRCPSSEPLGRSEEGGAFLLSTALNGYHYLMEVVLQAFNGKKKLHLAMQLF
jgi:hypothetical protein